MLKRLNYQNNETTEEVHHVFTYEDAYKSPLMRQYFQTRKSVFVDGMGWELPCNDLGEVDQYDRENVRYVLSERDGEFTSGLRMMPTTTKFTGRDGKDYTYMIKDSREGRLNNMPLDLIDCEAPVDEKIWEMTRVITPREPHYLKRLMIHASRFVKNEGGTHFLFHTRPAAGRIAKIWGLDVGKMGPAVPINDVVFQVHKVSTF